MTTEQTFYRLTKPIENPDVDRRMKHDWRTAEIVEPGDFIVRRWFDQDLFDLATKNGKGNEEQARRHCTKVAISPVRGSRNWPLERGALHDLLAKELEPAEENLHFLMADARYVSARSILRKLVDEGIIGLGAVKIAIAALQADLDTEEE